MSAPSGLGRLVPFAEHLGIRLTYQGPGKAVLELDIRRELMNSWRVAHGGAVMTLADIALAVAARTFDASAKGAMTVELKVSFIAPGRGRLIAEGRCLHAGRSLAFCEGEVRNEGGTLVAKAVGTFMLRRGRDTGDDGIEQA